MDGTQTLLGEKLNPYCISGGSGATGGSLAGYNYRREIALQTADGSDKLGWPYSLPGGRQVTGNGGGLALTGSATGLRLSPGAPMLVAVVNSSAICRKTN